MWAAKKAGAVVSLDLASFELVRSCKGTLLQLMEEGLLDLVFANEEEAVALAEELLVMGDDTVMASDTGDAGVEVIGGVTVDKRVTQAQELLLKHVQVRKGGNVPEGYWRDGWGGGWKGGEMACGRGGMACAMGVEGGWEGVWMGEEKGGGSGGGGKGVWNGGRKRGGIGGGWRVEWGKKGAGGWRVEWEWGGLGGGHSLLLFLLFFLLLLLLLLYVSMNILRPRCSQWPSYCCCRSCSCC